MFSLPKVGDYTGGLLETTSDEYSFGLFTSLKLALKKLLMSGVSPVLMLGYALLE
jgi:hypothetical protein